MSTILPHKMQVMWLGSGQQLKHVDLNDIPLLSTSVQVVECTRNLSQLTLSAHVSALCRAGYYQLQQLRPLVQSMTVEAARTAAAAFLSCQLDYCNSLLFGLPDTLLRLSFSLCRMPQHDWSLAHDAVIISRQYYVNCTGHNSTVSISTVRKQRNWYWDQ